MKVSTSAVLLLALAFVCTENAMARGDQFLQKEIRSRILGSEKLRNTKIIVHVRNRVVTLAGEVQLYEQKLFSERVVWTTLGVFDLKNSIRVVPRFNSTDSAIEGKIRELLKTHVNVRTAKIMDIRSVRGAVYISGNFYDPRIATSLERHISKIQGVISLKINVNYFALLYEKY